MRQSSFRLLPPKGLPPPRPRPHDPGGRLTSLTTPRRGRPSTGTAATVRRTRGGGERTFVAVPADHAALDVRYELHAAARSAGSVIAPLRSPCGRTAGAAELPGLPPYRQLTLARRRGKRLSLVAAHPRGWWRRRGHRARVLVAGRSQQADNLATVARRRRRQAATRRRRG